MRLYRCSVGGGTYTNTNTGTVYTYKGTHPNGYWTVSRAGVVGQATQAEVQTGTDNIKYVTPYAMSDVKDTANDALSRTNGGDIEALINPKAGVKGRLTTPNAGEIGEVVIGSDVPLDPYLETGVIVDKAPLPVPSAGVWQLSMDMQLHGSLASVLSGHGAYVYVDGHHFVYSSVVTLSNHPVTWIIPVVVQLGYKAQGSTVSIAVSVNGSTDMGTSTAVSLRGVTWLRVA